MRAHPDKAFQRGLFDACSRVMLDAHAAAAAGDRARARHRHRGRLPARRRCATSRSPPTSRRFAVLGRERRPVLLDAGGGARAQRRPQAGDGDAPDRRIHRRRDGARARARQPRRPAPSSSTPRWRSSTDAILAKTPVAIRCRQAHCSTAQIELGLDDAYALATETMACNMMSERRRRRASTPSSPRSRRRAGRDASLPREATELSQDLAQLVVRQRHHLVPVERPSSSRRRPGR